MSPPAVGERREVPCVAVLARGGTLYLPTLGPWHADPELAPEVGLHVHYHPQFFDLRLLLPRVRASASDLPPEQLLLVIAHLPSCGLTWDESRADPLVSREVVCLREMPAFPRGHESAPWLPLAERAYAGMRVRPGTDGCRRCPHRGTVLDGLPVRRESGERPCAPHRECVHGLRWAEAGGHLVLDPGDLVTLHP